MDIKWFGLSLIIIPSMVALGAIPDNRECARFWLEKGLYSQELDTSLVDAVDHLDNSVNALALSAEPDEIHTARQSLADIKHALAALAKDYARCYRGSRLEDQVKVIKIKIAGIEGKLNAIEEGTEAARIEARYYVDAIQRYKDRAPSDLQYIDDNMRVDLMLIRSDPDNTLIKFQVEAFKPLTLNNRDAQNHPTGANMYDGLGNPLILKSFMPKMPAGSIIAQGAKQNFTLIFQEENIIITKNVEVVLEKGSVGNTVPIHFQFEIQDFKK